MPVTVDLPLVPATPIDSGAASLAEISHFGLPSILVPYPFAADDHQTANARIYEQAGAALLIREGESIAAELSERIPALLADPAKLTGMSRRSRELAPEDAAARVADVVLNAAKPRP